ncbi:Ger(x)C family spore germination protein [Pontibacillus salipaludis]|uniref:Germination protein KC n=1 Tax=Pontibacillus salipaludis TaxID=1697394 RepID=A0ABQ1Q6G9_9BACI|nr:Ger(x)C family spore germination protein [Pontibacillus salipaludis]GGD16342.1 germination protein KC [Pontibacillus salipaludis]
MRIGTKALIIITCLILLTGCWDQRQFKNVKLVLAAGFDAGNDGLIRNTVVIPTVEKGLEGPGQEFIQVITSEAYSTRDGKKNVDHRISRSFDASKARVFLLGEEVARHDIFPILDVLYRDPKNNLNAKLAMVMGSAEEALRLRVNQEPRISGYISGILDSQMMNTEAPTENLQLICAELLEEGEDFGLPALEVDQDEGLINYVGMALFSDQKYSGVTLTTDESLLLLLLDDKLKRSATINRKVTDNEEEPLKNYVSIEVGGVKRKMNIQADAPDDIKVTMTMKLKAKIVEKTLPVILNDKEVAKLEKKYSEILTKDMQSVIQKTQEANSDFLGIGRRVHAFNHPTWEKVSWIDTYPNITFNIDTKVDLSGHGVIN